MLNEMRMKFNAADGKEKMGINNKTKNDKTKYKKIYIFKETKQKKI